jgi:hypothetical protein
MKAEKIEWLKEYHYLHNTLKFKKAEVIGGILKKYRYSPEKYESKKAELLKLIDKNKALFEKYKNKDNLTASTEKEFILK